MCAHKHEAPEGACCGNCLRWIAKADRGTGRCNNTSGFRVGTGHIEIDWVEILTAHDFCCNRYQGSY